MVGPKSGAREPVRDTSDYAASHVLLRRGGAPGEQAELHFADRTRFVRILAFGSWGTVITAPMGVFVANGELPEGSWAGAILVGALGVGLLYATLRAALNGSRLERRGPELVCRRAPLWPTWTRRYAIADIESARMRVRPPSFLHPGRYRGYPVAQPFLVDVVQRDGRTRTLPLALGLADAESVASWVNARVG